MVRVCRPSIFFALAAQFLFFLPFFLFGTPESQAAVFEIGPGKQFSTISDVPWESLLPGDTVLIHWRPKPYTDKWVIGRSGTATSPIVVRGVPGPQGALPIIDANGARTRSSLNFWNEARGLLKIGGSRRPDGAIAQHIVIENLDFRGARPPNQFVSAEGATQPYQKNAAAIYIERGHHIVIRGCEIHDSGNGLFVSSGDKDVSKDILVEHNHIFDNGNEGSDYEHNSYTAAAGIIFQFNHFGPLRAGCRGINLKDRSAGTVVRYNWIEGGNLELSLVEANDSRILRQDPRYGKTFVYGNIIVEPPKDGLGLIARYGGDSRKEALYRKGTLYFYNNTIVSERSDRTTLFKLESDGESCDFRNNIVYARAPGRNLRLLEAHGVLNLSHNWLKTGLKNNSKIHDDGTSLNGDFPGFSDAARQDYRLASDSPCIDAAGPLATDTLPTHNFVSTYVKHQKSAPRPQSSRWNIGACETASTKLSQ